MAFDWGSSHPFSVGWWAIANGETVEWTDYLGQPQSITLTRGTLVRFFEWYGTKEIGTNKGLVMSARDIADGINERNRLLVAGGWIAETPAPGPADNQIRNVNEKDTETIEKKMADRGVRWIASDKSKGSRKQGLQLLRDRLEATIRQEGSGLVIMENCRAWIGTVPDLPRDETDPDDVDTTAEDHVYDETRYMVLMTSDRTAKVIKLNIPT